jgi:hypothetical protein
LRKENVMPEEVKVTCRSTHSGSLMGSFWIVGWLFTIGYLKLAFWKGLLALIVWPYFLGAFFHSAASAK